MKKVVTIQDISGFGKCSLTVALPIISAMGVSLSVVPTAVLSTHTAIDGYTYHDLTADIPFFTKHYKELGLIFDTIYTGFLASPKQIDLIIEFFKTFNAKIVVDPVMGDQGKLYNCFDKDMIAQFKKLLPFADIITPNITEALFLLDKSYAEEKNAIDENYIKQILRQLSEKGPKKVVITGIELDNGQVSVFVYDRDADSFSFFGHDKVDAHFPGTGDVFCSTLVGSLTKGIDIHNSAKIAASFVHSAIVATVKAGSNPLFGLNFEPQLKNFFVTQ